MEEEWEEEVDYDWEMENPRCGICGSYYCPCCGCDCYANDLEDEED